MNYRQYPSCLCSNPEVTYIAHPQRHVLGSVSVIFDIGVKASLARKEI